MNKSRAIAFVVASIVSAASVAGAQSTTPRAAGDARVARAAQGRGRAAGLLKGLTLSATEKTKLKEIRGSYRGQASSLHESLKPAMQDARIARQKGDTAAARAVFERTKGDREKLRAVMDRQRSELRAALSPANQKQFDANVRQAGLQRSAAGKKARGNGQARGGRRAHGVRNGSPTPDRVRL